MTTLASPKGRRFVTILFTDVVDSTAFVTESDMEVASDVLNAAVREIVTSVESFSGTVLQVMGDGVLAIFGVPKALEDHAVLACQAAIDIQKRIARYAETVRTARGPEVRVRVGINSGSVVVGVIEGGAEAGYDVHGSPVHLASRIETNTPAGRIGLSRYTFYLVQGYFECSLLGKFALKGFKNLREIYQLVRMYTNAERRGKGRVAPMLTPLVGRDEIFNKLLGEVHRLKDGRGSVVVVQGEAGVGKTRFVHEAGNSLSGYYTWLEVKPALFEGRAGYRPFADLLRAWLGLADDPADSTAWPAAEQRLRELFGAEADDLIPYLAVILLPDAAERFAERIRFLDRDSLSRQIARATRRFFESIARRGPTVVVFDDLHRLDASSLDLVENLLDLVTTLPILMWVLSRPGVEPVERVAQAARRHAGLRLSMLSLEPLDDAQCELLVEYFLGAAPATRSVRDEIIGKAGGNPFFVEELVHTVTARALTVDSSLEADAVAAAHIDIPDTVQGAILARVDQLPGQAKEILEIASVIGRTFELSVLALLTNSPHDLNERLEMLEAEQLIISLKDASRPTFAFRHALTQNAVYESLLSAARKALHERVADGMLARHASGEREVSSILAFHYGKSGNAEKSLTYLLAAAEGFRRIAADNEALECYEEALSAHARSGGNALAVWQQGMIEVTLGEIYLHRGRLDRSEHYFLRALARFGDPPPRTAVHTMAAIAREIVRQALNRFLLRIDLFKVPSKSVEAHLRAYEGYTWLSFFTNQRHMLYAVLRTLNISERECWDEGVAKSSAAVGYMLSLAGFNHAADHYYRRALQVAEASRHPGVIGLATSMHAVHFVFVGRWPEALARFEEARNLAHLSGDLPTWASSITTSILILRDQGAFDTAAAINGELERISRDAAFRVGQRWALMNRGKILWRRGSYDEAHVALTAARDRAKKEDDAPALCDIWGELGLSLAAQGHLDAALLELREAHRVASRTGVRLHTHVSVYIGLAEVAVAQLLRAPGPGSRRERAAARRCTRLAIKVARRFSLGLVRALRTAGKLYDHLRDRGRADKCWKEAVEVGEALGARFELALTLIDLGSRNRDRATTQRGDRLLEELGVRLRDGAEPLPGEARRGNGAS